MSEARSVSLVATLLDEYGSLPGWLEGLRGQSRHPDECVIVDGGSTDGTWEMLRGADLPFPTRLLRYPGTTISQARNIGIASTSGEIVVVTDAGTRANADWLERIVEPLERAPDVDLVGGFFKPEYGGLWSRTLAATTLPDASEIDQDRFLASSRSFAFRRAWFDHGFRYPEWLDYCEDVVFDLRFRRGGARQVFRGDAVVNFEPRAGPEGFARQYYRYGRGDGRAGLFAHRHAVRYLTYLTAAVALQRRRPAVLMAAFALAFLYLRAPLARYRRRHPEDRLHPGRLTLVFTLIAAQRLLGDIAKMVGYPVGILWRINLDGSGRLWKTGWASRSFDGRPQRP